MLLHILLNLYWQSQHNQPGYEFRTSSSVINLKEKKLPQFLILIYNETELDGEEEAMKMIGIKRLIYSKDY